MANGRHIAIELSAANWHQLWVPPGFAHGYITLEEDCEVIYKVTEYYAPDCDRGIAWDDPAFGIDWRLPASEVILSEKDRQQPRLAEEGRVHVRNVRRDVLEQVKKAKLPEDETKRLEKEIQTNTDKSIKDIESHLAHKEKELTTV